ncbi:hypothetical protein NPIL_116661 [Nephila pilipes]|uniref:Uncharacterized protein n=1 Tax=Nephila pilipes TaxID=299642 RepID=A0A8X6J544_NEPPI|nr:hypothetical protein NPIL_116661 [Nephila pilipes]
MTAIRQRYGAMITFCGIMDMDFLPPVAERPYNNAVNTVRKRIKEVSEAPLQITALAEVSNLRKQRKGSPAYKQWKTQLKNECLINLSGWADLMETDGMVRIFRQ